MDALFAEFTCFSRGRPFGRPEPVGKPSSRETPPMPRLSSVSVRQEQERALALRQMRENRYGGAGSTSVPTRHTCGSSAATSQHRANNGGISRDAPQYGRREAPQYNGRGGAHPPSLRSRLEESDRGLPRNTSGHRPLAPAPAATALPWNTPGHRTSLAPAAASTACRSCSQQPGGSSTASSSSAQQPGSSGTVLIKCDKCDGAHPTDSCPWFKRPRERHPDANPATGRKQLGGSGVVEILRSARVVRQPGDGSCLFHSLSYGLRDGSAAHALRRQVASFIEANPELTISDSPLRDWVNWDSGQSVSSYCRRMAQGGVWGGGIEMAAVSHLKRVNVFVYQSIGGGFKRISSFEVPHATKVVRVLYGGGVHYDALDAGDRPISRH